MTEELFEIIVGDNPTLGDESARAQLLRAAIRHLLRDDESSIRVLQMSRQIGMSASVIYSNFGSRQGLVDAAYLEIYRSVTAASRRNLAALADAVRTREDLEARWAPGAQSPEHEHRQALRRRLRLQVLGKTISRRRLAESVFAERRVYQGELADYFQGLIDAGVVRSPLSARQLAAFHLGLHVARAVDDASGDALSADEWSMVKRVVFGFAG